MCEGEWILDGYVTVERPAMAEFVEKKSRFIAEIRPVDSEEAFAAFLAEKRSAHWDASHNCSAFLLRGGNIQRYSDDGEPQGTAGIPILEVIRKEGLEDCGIVVTRYFGGTLLGAGGLVRAYTHSAKLAVDAAVRVEICRCQAFSLSVPYALYDRLQLLLQDRDALVLETDFGAEVSIRAQLRAEDFAPFAAQLTELSSGGVAPEQPEEVYSAMPTGERQTR